MRILIGILSELSHERRQERMAASLRAAGHDVSITWVDNGTWPLSPFWEGWDLHRLENPRDGRRKRYFLRFMRWFRRLIEAEQPDLVLAVDPPALGPASRARGKFRLVYDSREYWRELPTIRERKAVRWYWDRVEALGMRRADSAFTVCGSIARELAERHGRSVGIVRNMPQFNWKEDSSTARRVLRERLGLPAETRLITYAGGFWPGYDFRPLMDALKHLPEDVHLLFFGEGPGEQKHRDHAFQQALAERVHFAGKVPPDELPTLLEGADLGVVLTPDLGLSYRYLLPNKLFEYVQAGLPVLSSPLPELASVVAGRGLGALADPENPELIANAARRMLIDEDQASLKERLRESAKELCWEREEALFLKEVLG